MDKEENIIKNKNIKKDKFTATEVIILLVICCIVSVTATVLIKSETSILNSDKYIPVSNSKELANLISTYNFIKENYYETIDDTTIIDGAIKGMLDATGDPYSTYMDSNEYNNFNITIQGSYQGLGVEIAQIDSKITIVSIFKDSPALKAGLQLGDIIKSIDDKDATTMTTADFSKYVQENKNPNIKLVIERNKEEQTYNIEREEVVLKSVATQTYEESGKKIGYIYVSIFAANTNSQFKEAIESLEKENIDSLIIDLRGNSGGHLTSVTDMISVFMDEKHVIYQIQDKDETVKTFSTGKTNKEYKIVMLVDENSASASEVMTAALKENLKATVIGKTTYGKGTVQKLYDLPSGAQYKLTTQKWLTPNGNWINEKGIEPDIKVELSEEYKKNPTEANDNQLQKALQYLKEQ